MAGLKTYKSIIKKKKKKHDKIVLLAKMLNAIKILISKALINSYISRKQFVSISNALQKYNETKEEIKNPKTSLEYIT